MSCKIFSDCVEKERRHKRLRGALFISAGGLARVWHSSRLGLLIRRGGLCISVGVAVLGCLGKKEGPIPLQNRFSLHLDVEKLPAGRAGKQLVAINELLASICNDSYSWSGF